LSALLVIQCTQLLPERTRHFLGGNLFEGAAQVRSRGPMARVASSERRR